MPAPRLLVAAALLAAAVPLPLAHATDPAPQGQPCSLASVGTPGDDTRHVVVQGGPVTADSDSVRITCAVHIDDAWSGGTPAASVSSDAEPGVAVLPPTTLTVEADADRYVGVCSSVLVGSTRWYWAYGEWITETGYECVSGPWVPWHTFPEAAAPVSEWLRCLFFGAWGPVECGPPRVTLDPAWAVVDPVVCAYLRAARPGSGPVVVAEDGDVHVDGTLVYDCPPYVGAP